MIDYYIDPEFGIGLDFVKNQYNENADRIEVHINSMGGDVREGFAIYDFLKSTGKPITTVITAKCYSIASIIFLAGTERLMYPNSEMMIHNPWGGIQGEGEEIIRYGELVDKYEKDIREFYAQITNQPVKDIEKWMDETTFMSPQEAIDRGFATGITEEMKAVAMINTKNKDMELNKEQKSWFAEQFEKISTAVKALGKSPMASVKLQSGDEILIDSEGNDWKDKKAFKADGKTVLDNGEFVLEDGQTVIIQDGIVSEIREPEKEPDELETVKAERDSLNEKVSNLEAELQKKTDDIKAQDAKVIEVQNSLNELRKTVFGEPPPAQKKDTESEPVGDDPMLKWYKEINS